MNIVSQLLLSAVMLLAQTAFAADPVSARLAVVASFSILGDIVANVGGDRITVTTLVGPDQDAHVFQPTPAHIKAVSRARLLVINGLGFEGWMERVARSAGYRGAILVASNGIAVRDRADSHDEALAEGHHHHRGSDPHAWQDPVNLETYIRNIGAALSEIDPAGAAVYRHNADSYLAKLRAVDQWAMAEFARLPDAKRKVITSHDAFEYFGAHYRVRFFAPQGLSTDSEPSAKDVATLIRQIKTEKIRAVFIENMSSPKLLQQISKEAGVTLGGKLYADALSHPQGPAPTYLQLMRHNIELLLAQLKLN